MAKPSERLDGFRFKSFDRRKRCLQVLYRILNFVRADNNHLRAPHSVVQSGPNAIGRILFRELIASNGFAQSLIVLIKISKSLIDLLFGNECHLIFPGRL